MAVLPVQTLTASITSGNSLSFASWTPSSYDLCLLSIASRDDDSDLVDDVAGNGLTWTLVRSVANDDNESRLRLYRAMGSAPIAGVVSITLEGNSEPVVAVLTRFSGAETSGINGSVAVETSSRDNGPSGSNANMKDDLTTISNNAFAFACGTHRDATFTVPGGETAISINNFAGAGSDETSCSTWYLQATTPGTVELGADGDLSENDDWAIIVASIRPSLIPVSDVSPNDLLRFMNRPRRITFETAGGDKIFSAWGWAELLDSSYSGNEVDGVQVKNTIRVLLLKSVREKVVSGDFVFLNESSSWLIISVKPSQGSTEIIAVFAQDTPGAEPDVIKTFDLSAATAETVIWQPVSGKRFRLLEVDAVVSGGASVLLSFRDGVGGSVILNGSTVSAYSPTRFGGGILSVAVDNGLTVTRDSSVTLQGHILGFEE